MKDEISDSARKTDDLKILDNVQEYVNDYYHSQTGTYQDIMHETDCDIHGNNEELDMY